jgi:hypothetical protein
MKASKFPVMIYGLLLFILGAQSCAPSRIIKPLEKGEQSLSTNLGGPLIKFGSAPIPIPLTSVMYARGLDNKTTAFGSLHTTSLLFGVIQTDIGICREIYTSEKLQLGLSVNPVLNFAFDTWEANAKLWPELDLNIHKDLFSKKGFVYLGAANWFEFSSTRAHGETQKTHWLINPHIGFNWAPKKWAYNIEAKYLAPGKNNQPNVVDYIGIQGKGALGVYFSIAKKF